MILTFLAALATATAPAPAPLAPAAAAQPATNLQKAEVLTGLTHPRETLLALNLKGWELASRERMALEPGTQNLERAHPGVTEAALKAGRPLAREYLAGLDERARKRRATLLSSRMTGAELDEAIRFFRGPGQRLMAGIWSKVRLEQVAKDAAATAIETGKPGIKAEFVQRVGRAAARDSLGALSAADNLAVLRFEQSAAGRKYLALQPELEAMDLQQANTPDQVFIQRQTEVMRAAVIAFVESRQ